jgi:plastocyanin
MSMLAVLRCLGGCCAVLLSALGLAAPVTVEVTINPGASAADMIIVFDPLDASPPATPSKASIDQVDKRFVPLISVVRTGTSVTFPNSDHIRHQVYSFSQAKKFTLKLYAGSQAPPVTFDQPGLVVLGCNIHDNMAAFLAVVDSPWFAKLSASGTAVFDLPPGRYRMRAWHPKLIEPLPSREIVVKGSAMTISVVTALDPASHNVSPWPDM